MTYEEFKELASNPVYPDHNCIYRIDAVCIEVPVKEIIEQDSFKLRLEKRLFYNDKGAAEESIRRLSEYQTLNSKLYAVYLYEIPLEKDTSNNQYQKVWVYDRLGNLIDQSYSTEIIDDLEHPSAKFRGRERSIIKFKPGDIVEVCLRSFNSIHINRGIVVACPLTIEECWGIFKQTEKCCLAEGLPAERADANYWLYAIDDCYKVLLRNSIHNAVSPRSWNVFPVTYPFTNSLREELQNRYKEHYSKEKNNDRGNCSFQELMDML